MSLRTALLTTFGRIAGNLLCQQYGIASDAYDITSDLAIAAFFATRSYPTYKPFQPSTADDLGVIYRFTIGTPGIPPLEMMERTLAWLYLIDDEYDVKVWFDDVRPLRARILRGEFEGDVHDNIRAYLREQFQDGYAHNHLFKSAAYVTYDMLEYAFVQRVKELELSSRPEMFMPSSRTRRQSGGIYFPPTTHAAFTSKVVTPEPLTTPFGRATGRDYLAKPGRAESLGAERVFNLNANPYIERFYFRYNPSKAIDIDDLETLWPSEKNDYLLEVVTQLCRLTEAGQYLEDFDTTPLDFEKGLIDPGNRIGE